jgi:hypothetical protein
MTPISFGSDSTIRWSCRERDYIIWARYDEILASPGREFDIPDFWVMKDGDWITITNRVQDLPAWFELHPLEAVGNVAYWLKERLDAGQEVTQPCDGPNIWKVFTGDRLVWVGPSRRGMEGENGVLGVISFHCNALVTGEPLQASHDLPMFGEIPGSGLPASAAALVRQGWLAACGLGTPRVMAAGDRWMLGL